MAGGNKTIDHIFHGPTNMDEVSPKRRRVALACNACRIRKSRCNGGHPRCSLCEQFDFECLYEASDTAANVIVRKDHMTGFDQRLKELEKKVKKHDELLYREETTRISKEGNISDAFKSRTTRHMPSNNGMSLDETQLQELPPEEELTDGMATSISFADEQDSGFFGPSSNIAFLRHIQRAMVSHSNSTEIQTSNLNDDLGQIDNGLVNAIRPLSPTAKRQSVTQQLEQQVSIFDLPSEGTTRDLLRRYFSNTGLLFPYIHDASFLETYERMKTDNFSRVRRTWLGLLNMILAMATITLATDHRSANDRLKDSDIFYQRAYQLCKRQMLRGTSLETVQYLLLMSQYLQGTQKSVQTWAIHGLAVKAALSLGLHSTDASRKFPPIEREMRKRTWYGCVILDRTLSMTFGRPNAIPQEYVRQPLPQPLEDEQSSIDLQQNARALSVHFFSASITLYKLQWKIIATLYGQNLGCDPPLSEMEIITRVFQLEQELTEWQHQLPPLLQLRNSATVPEERDNVSEERFRVVLTLRHLNTQVLLHLPCLVRSLELRSKPENQSQSTDRMMSGFIQTCVKSSEEVISLFHSIVTATKRETLGASWFSLYYTFNAALVIFGSLLVSPQHSVMSTIIPDQIERANFFLSKAVEALKLLDEGVLVPTARCAEYLSHLSSILQQWAGNIPQNLSSEDVNLQSYQQIFRPLGLVNYDLPQTVGGFEMDSFLANDLELGQFFSPAEMGRWVDNGKGRQGMYL